MNVSGVSLRFHKSKYSLGFITLIQERVRRKACGHQSWFLCNSTRSPYQCPDKWLLSGRCWICSLSLKCRQLFFLVTFIVVFSQIFPFHDRKKFKDASVMSFTHKSSTVYQEWVKWYFGWEFIKIMWFPLLCRPYLSLQHFQFSCYIYWGLPFMQLLCFVSHNTNNDNYLLWRD